MVIVLSGALFGAGTPESKKIELTFLQYTASGSQESTLSDMIAEFEKRNPDIDVQEEVLAWADYYTKLNTVINAGKAAPDVFEVGYENFMTYATRDLLLDLTPVIKQDSEFDESTYKKLAYDAFSYNGKQYGIVQNFSVVVMFYNKKLFDQHGLSYPSPEWTWGDELAAAQVITDKENGIWGTYSPIQFWEFYKTIAQNGGSIFSPDNSLVTIDSAACVDALQWMFDKAERYNVSPPLNDDSFTQPDHDLNEFKAGRIGMARFGIWNFGRFSDAEFEWDIALEPGNTQKAHHFFADGLVVSKTTEKGEAAWKFIKFMTADPVVIDLRIDRGWSLPAINNDSMMEKYYRTSPPDSKEVVFQALDSLVLPPVGPIADRWNELTSAVGDEITKARLGLITAKEALDNAKEKIQLLINQ